MPQTGPTIDVVHTNPNAESKRTYISDRKGRVMGAKPESRYYEPGLPNAHWNKGE